MSAVRGEEAKAGTLEQVWEHNRPYWAYPKGSVEGTFTPILPKSLIIKPILWDMLDGNIIPFPTF